MIASRLSKYSNQALKIICTSLILLIVLMCTTEKKLTELYLNVPFLKQTLTVMKTIFQQM